MGPGDDRLVRISAIIPTYHREELLREAVLSVLSQKCPDAQVEVVVVNDAGAPLSADSWQDDPRVRVANTYHTERSVARNTGAALSCGDWLHFLDDDDTLVPGAYQALLDAAGEKPGAVLSCGSYLAVAEDCAHPRAVAPTVDDRIFAVLVAGIGIPLGACLLERSAFFRAGGFDISFSVMEDLELLQRVVGYGDCAATRQVVARFRVDRHSDSTTDWRAASDSCRRQREKAFSMRDCYCELSRSLRHPKSAGLRGRLVRFYLGSGARHLRSGSLATAAGRLSAGLLLGLHGALAPAFWRGAFSRENTPEL